MQYYGSQLLYTLIRPQWASEDICPVLLFDRSTFISFDRLPLFLPFNVTDNIEIYLPSDGFHKLQHLRNDILFLFLFFCQSLMRCGQLVYHPLMPPQNCHASYNDLFSHACLKVSTNSSNSVLFASLSTAINPKFMINLSNPCCDIVI